jgi:nitrogen fixation protein FixH
MNTGTETTAPANGGFRFTGRHMLMIMVAFFGTIVTVNGFMAYKATSTWTGLIVKNGYVASQDFNHLQEEWRAQAARGWTGDISYGAGMVSFTLTGKDGKPVVLDQVSAQIGRPAFNKDDHSLQLNYTGSGRYEAAGVLAKGPWAITVTGQSPEGPYRLEKRIMVKDGQ